MKVNPLFTEHPFTPAFNTVLNDHPTLRVATDWGFSWDAPKFVNPVNPLTVMPKQRKRN